FQALRIAVNHEMESLAALLRDGPAMLNPGGRMLIISYHSLEDRPVKERFRELAQTGDYVAIARKVIKPSSSETSRNPRARSARIRCIERSAR
ncbi:MAG: 16S rRNA (cytosine(1402)-N(4))-methyltransferase, partial [Candidatus Binatus sp.]